MNIQKRHEINQLDDQSLKMNATFRMASRPTRFAAPNTNTTRSIQHDQYKAASPADERKYNNDQYTAVGYRQPVFQKTKLHKSAVASPVLRGTNATQRNPMQMTGGLKVNFNGKMTLPSSRIKSKNEMAMI